ncbi:hypothetical protein ACFLRG_02795 [Bacteroidota bacterium]
MKTVFYLILIFLLFSLMAGNFQNQRGQNNILLKNNNSNIYRFSDELINYFINTDNSYDLLRLQRNQKFRLLNEQIIIIILIHNKFIKICQTHRPPLSLANELSTSFGG